MVENKHHLTDSFKASMKESTLGDDKTALLETLRHALLIVQEDVRRIQTHYDNQLNKRNRLQTQVQRNQNKIFLSWEKLLIHMENNKSPESWSDIKKYKTKLENLSKIYMLSDIDLHECQCTTCECRDGHTYLEKIADHRVENQHLRVLKEMKNKFLKSRRGRHEEMSIMIEQSKKKIADLQRKIATLGKNKSIENDTYFDAKEFFHEKSDEGTYEDCLSITLSKSVKKEPKQVFLAKNKKDFFGTYKLNKLESCTIL